MPIALLILALDLFCIFHCSRNNKSFWWIIAIIFLSPFGAFAYLFMEYLPEYTGNSRRGFQPLRQASTVDNIAALEEALAISDTVYNRERLADAYAQKGQYADAMREYEQCLSGRYAEDTGIMFKYAECSFEHGDYARCLELLDRFMSLSDTRRNECFLLKARSHEFLGEIESARRLYEQLFDNYPNLEAKGHYARFLIAQDERSKAQPIVNEIAEYAKTLSRHQRELHWEIISFAKREARKNSVQ